MATRRSLLITGGAAVLVGGLGFACYQELHSDLSPARAPWGTAGTRLGDPRLDALAYAVLAPSPHNRQPWLIDLVDTDKLVLYCDRTRLLPETDPENRQIVVGLGCFLEVLRQAAAEDGVRLETTLFPDGADEKALDDRPIATVSFIREETERDPLFASVFERRTNRTPFDQAKPVGADVLAALSGALRSDDGAFGSVVAPDAVAELKALNKRAWSIEVSTEATHAESVKLTRVGEKAVNANPDGISLAGPAIEAFRLAGMLSPENLYGPDTTAYNQTLSFYEGLIDSAMAFAWLTTPDNSRQSQINAGAGWVRLQLEATRQGLAFQPLSQALQEFPEMAAEFKNIHDFVAARSNDQQPGRIQGLFRLGYAAVPPAAPRWPMQSRLIETAG
ncbi:MAG: twin-arginine translocation pathway signal protein [Pseudomonadota bacterium]